MLHRRMKLAIRPVTADLWPALEDLFGKKGACNGCWCMYWRIGPAYRERPREENRADLRRLVRRGPPPGLLAFDGDTAVGWCQLTPRSDLVYLESRPMFASVDPANVWSISCFYVRRGWRGKGVTEALIRAAVAAARAAGAIGVEAYPYERAADAYTGYASTFARAGFEEIARHQENRPILRRMLAPPNRRNRRRGAAPKRRSAGADP